MHKESPAFDFVKACKKNRVLIFLSFLFLLPNYLFESMVIPFWKEQGFSWSDIALTKGIWGAAGAFAGAHIATMFCGSKNLASILRSCIFLNAVVHCLPLLFISTKSFATLSTLFFFTNLVHNFMSSAFLIFTVYITSSYRQYDFFMGISYVSFAIGGVLGGSLAEIGWMPFFLITALSSILLGVTNFPKAVSKSLLSKGAAQH